jgi:CheY-like chemotaxis protein
MYTPTRVLVVDDEPLIAMLAADWLTELGYDVAGPVGKVEEGLRLLEEGTLDGALLDVNLGTGDSFSLADAARAKGIPVGFITGQAAASLPPRFRGSPVLPKPFDLASMKQTMEALMAGTPRG